MADFDMFPPPELSTPVQPELQAQNAPLVAGATTDHPTYLVPRGEADLLFPVHFPHIKALHRHVYGAAVGAEVVKSEEFVRQYADVAATKTMSGYNPMVSDYSNTSFLLSPSRYVSEDGEDAQAK